MARLYRTRVSLTGWQGGPGVNTWYWSAGIGANPESDSAALASAHDEIYGVYERFKPFMVDEVFMLVEPAVDVIDPATGNILDVIIDSTSRDPLSGSDTAEAMPRNVQLCVNYYTDNFQGGKRLRGRHYIGPVGQSAVDTTGATYGPLITNTPGYYTAMTTGLGIRLAVWHRPTSKGASDGYYGDVTGIRMKDKPATLRSRRD